MRFGTTCRVSHSNPVQGSAKPSLNFLHRSRSKMSLIQNLCIVLVVCIISTASIERSNQASLVRSTSGEAENDSLKGCALCLSEKDEFGPDQKWRQTVCALARQFRWTRCTSDTLFVLVEIPTTVDNAKQTCLDQAITFDGWPKAAIDDEPSVYDRRPILQLASIQDCEEIGHVNNLSQKLQNKASTFQLWFDQRSTHYHVESTSSAQALRFVRSSPPHDHTASTGQTSATPQSSVTLTSSSFSDNATAATSRLKPETANEIASTNEQLRSHYHRKHLTAEIPRLPKWFELGSSELKRSQYFWGNLFRTDGRRSRRSVTNAYRTISPYRITAQPTSDSTMNMRTGQGWNPRPHRLDQKSGITKERARSRSSAPARYNLISYHQYQADADQTLESALNPVRRSSNAKVPVVNANKEKSLHKYDSELFSRVLCADKSASPTYTMRDASNEPLTETNAKGEPTGYVLCEIRRSTSSSTLLPSSSPSFSPSSPAPFTSPYSTAEHRAQSPVLIPKWLDTLQQSIDRIEQINNDSDHNQNVTVESIQRFADELHRSLRTERMQNIQTLHRTLDLTERLQRNFDRQMQRLSDQESKVRNGTTSGPAQSTAIESDGVDHRRRHEFARSLLQGYSALLDEQQQPVWRQSEPQKRTQTAERMLDHVLKLIVKLSCNLDPDHVRSEAEQVSADHMLIEAIRLPVKQLSNQFQFPASNTSIDSISHSWIRFPFGLNLTKTLTSDTLNPTVSPWQSCFNHQLHHARPNQSVNHNGQQVAFGALIAHISQHLISRSIEMDDEKSTPSTIDSFVRLDRLVLHQHVIVGSPLLMFNLHRDLNHSHSLPQPVRIELRHLRRLNVGERSVCGFWNVTRGSWDTRGCRLIDFNREATTCECDHLTSFAVLIDIRPTHDPPYSEFWDRVAFACTVISTVGLIATGFIFMCIRRLRRNLRNRITVHLCFCLALINVVVCFGMQWDNVKACTWTSVFLYMALMSAFAWMASQGFFLYLVVYVIFDIERYDLKQFGAICYGVGIAQTLGMYLWNGPTFFYDPGHSYYCWLSIQGRTEQTVIAFISPIFVLLANLVLVVASMYRTWKSTQTLARESGAGWASTNLGAKSNPTKPRSNYSKSSVAIVSTDSNKEKSKSHRSRPLKGWFTQFLLLGLIWFTAFAAYMANSPIGNLTFSLVNGLQGSLIFVLEVLCHKNNRTILRQTIVSKWNNQYFWMHQQSPSTSFTSDRGRFSGIRNRVFPAKSSLSNQS